MMHMFDAYLDKIKHNALLHLAIVCFISVFAFVQWSKNATDASCPIGGALFPVVGEDAPSGLGHRK